METRTIKKTLLPSSPLMIQPQLTADELLEWVIDSRLWPVIVQHTDSFLMMLLDDGHFVPSGFYSIDVIHKNIAGNQTVLREEYFIRVSMGRYSDVITAIGQSTNVVPDITDCNHPAQSINCAVTPLVPSSPPIPASIESETTDNGNTTCAPVSLPSDEQMFRSAVEQDDILQREDEPSSSTYRPIPPELHGRYEVVLIRDGIVLRGTETVVEEGTTVVVGKDTACGLSLKSYFKNNDMARKCSKKQIEVFWHDGRVYAKNVGANSVTLSSANPQKLSQNEGSYWPENSQIVLPGNLSILLRKAIS